MNISEITNSNFQQIKKVVDDILAKATSKYSDPEFEKLAGLLCFDHRKNVQKLGLKMNAEKDKFLKEVTRVKSMYDFDKKFLSGKVLIGVDEVGRGPFAGPIVAAAVVLNLDYRSDEDLILGIKDSKALSAKQRDELAAIILNKAASYKIIEISSNEIDERGLAWANNEVLKLAAEALKDNAELVLSDGFPIKGISLKNEFVIKGDAKSASIACASIIAKVYRDNLMQKLEKEYPEYGFSKNSGYGTSEHIEAIKKYGITKIHRKSFLKNIIEKSN